ncbi:CHRD domain-containing protein [Zoogloea oleivorans]|uniref:CHRD domain-containing protein n=2 Tax=Zoogloeaceae TaxID=2008794 RepID=A0A6C2CY36_9RHOO|nr:CHRD domain-containing protein [Zoogloea sp.]TYC58533.1 CHRD domain-containing protein [Zoogloea oleivorans]
MNRQAGFPWLLAGVLSLSAPLAQADLLVYSADLTPEITGATGSGTATVTIDTVLHSMLVNVVFSGLSGVTTAAHIHCCTAVPGTGTAGVATQTPTFSGFPGGVSAGTYLNTFDLTLPGSWNTTFVNNNGGTPALAEVVLLAGLEDERTYLNIHTNLFPGGEIRGFLVRNVAEPGSMALLGLAVSGLMITRRRGLKPLPDPRPGASAAPAGA